MTGKFGTIKKPFRHKEEVTMVEKAQQAKRGWHNDPEGHAKAGSKSSGKFTKGSERARKAGRKGGLK